MKTPKKVTNKKKDNHIKGNKRKKNNFWGKITVGKSTTITYFNDNSRLQNRFKQTTKNNTKCPMISLSAAWSKCISIRILINIHYLCVLFLIIICLF